MSVMPLNQNQLFDMHVLIFYKDKLLLFRTPNSDAWKLPTGCLVLPRAVQRDISLWSDITEPAVLNLVIDRLSLAIENGAFLDLRFVDYASTSTLLQDSTFVFVLLSISRFYPCLLYASKRLRPEDRKSRPPFGLDKTRPYEYDDYSIFNVNDAAARLNVTIPGHAQHLCDMLREKATLSRDAIVYSQHSPTVLADYCHKMLLTHICISQLRAAKVLRAKRQIQGLGEYIMPGAVICQRYGTPKHGLFVFPIGKSEVECLLKAIDHGHLRRGGHALVRNGNVAAPLRVRCVGLAFELVAVWSSLPNLDGPVMF